MGGAQHGGSWLREVRARLSLRRLRLHSLEMRLQSMARWPHHHTHDHEEPAGRALRHQASKLEALAISKLRLLCGLPRLRRSLPAQARGMLLSSNPFEIQSALSNQV